MGISLNDVQRGYNAWAAKPHNAKWVRKIDGTPIPNDIVVTIFDTLRDIEACPSPQPNEGGDAISIAARYNRLRSICARILWLDLGVPAMDSPQTQAAMSELAEVTFMDALIAAGAVEDGVAATAMEDGR